MTESKETAVSDAALAGRYVAANGIDIFYEEKGAGHPLLLLHGGSSTHHDWETQIPAWAPHFRAIMPDNRGHGRTVNPGGPLTYEVMAQDALALIDALDLEKPIVCGWNDGACVALQMAVWAPERASAWVFMDAWLWNAKEASYRGMMRLQKIWGLEGSLRAQLTDDDLAQFEKHVPQYVAHLQQHHQDPSGAAYWKTFLRNSWPGWTNVAEHGAEELKRITPPTLVAVGDRDVWQPLDEAVALYNHLPNAELAVIPGIDGSGPLGAQANILSQVVLNFLLRHVSVPTARP